MESLFIWCAVLGGSIFAFQFVTLLLGLHGGHDFDHPELNIHAADVPDIHTDFDHVSVKDADIDFDRHPDSFDHSDGWFVGIVTIRSMVAALTVFGLTGLAAKDHLSPERTIALASLAGLGMLYLVGWSFKQLYKLQSDGTVRMRDTIECTGTVYLRIPGRHEGAGKVTVEVAGRTMEYQAMTSGDSLQIGTPIVVSALISEDMLEVESQLPAEAATSGTQQNT